MNPNSTSPTHLLRGFRVAALAATLTLIGAADSSAVATDPTCTACVAYVDDFDNDPISINGSVYIVHYTLEGKSSGTCAYSTANELCRQTGGCTFTFSASVKTIQGGTPPASITATSDHAVVDPGVSSNNASWRNHGNGGVGPDLDGVLITADCNKDGFYRVTVVDNPAGSGPTDVQADPVGFECQNCTTVIHNPQ